MLKCSYFAFVLGLIMVVYLTGCSSNNQPEETSTPLPIPSFSSPLYFEGRIIAQDSFEMSFSQPGIIDEFMVKLGDTVDQGDILAKLNTTNLTEEIKLAEAALSLAEANLQVVTERIPRPTEGEIAVAQAQVDEATIKLEIAQLKLNEAELVAPIAGTITRIYTHQYEYAFAGQPVLQLKDVGNLSVEVIMDIFDLAGISIGDNATITFENLPGIEVDGRVASILPDEDVDRGGQLIVTVDILENEESIQWGLPANVVFDDASE